MKNVNGVDNFERSNMIEMLHEPGEIIKENPCLVSAWYDYIIFLSHKKTQNTYISSPAFNLSWLTSVWPINSRCCVQPVNTVSEWFDPLLLIPCHVHNKSDMIHPSRPIAFAKLEKILQRITSYGRNNLFQKGYEQTKWERIFHLKRWY